MSTETAASAAADACARLRQAAADLSAIDVAMLSGHQAAQVAHDIHEVSSSLAGTRAAALIATQRCGVWALDGSRSMPAWLTRTERSSYGSARADLALAETLERHLPLTGAALRSNEVSLDGAKALARWTPTSSVRQQALADGGEEFLLGKAQLLDIADLTKAARFWAYRVDPDADDEAYAPERTGHFLEVRPTMGGHDIRGFLPTDGGETVRVALAAFTGVPAKDDRRTVSQRNADALVGLARHVLDSGEHGAGMAVRPHLNVSVSYDSLLAEAGKAGVDPAVLTDTGEPIPRSVLDRIACDSEVNRVVFGPDSRPLDVGRSRRTVTPGQRRAVIARDRECARPGCHAPPHICAVHHVIAWQLGGATSVVNSVLLCWACHDWIHRTGVRITRGPDCWNFSNRYGDPIP